MLTRKDQAFKIQGQGQGKDFSLQLDSHAAPVALPPL